MLDFDGFGVVGFVGVCVCVYVCVFVCICSVEMGGNCFWNKLKDLENLFI